MADINLSKAVRSNLSSLQNTAALMSKTSDRLSTGNKVNSALDNPTNFFTASSLNSRAGDLNQLMDSMNNGIKTIEAANNGLTAVTKTLESMQSTVRQARQDKSFQTQSYGIDKNATGNVTFSGGSLSAATSFALPAAIGDSASVTGTKLTTATANITGSTKLNEINANASASTPATINVGDTLKFDLGSGTSSANVSITFVESGASGNNQVNITDSLDTLKDKINAIAGDINGTGLGSTGITADVTGGMLTFTNNNTTAGPANDVVISGTGNAAVALLGNNGAAITAVAATSNVAATGQTARQNISVAANESTRLDQLSSALLASDNLVINGKTIDLEANANVLTGSSTAGYKLGVQSTLGDLMKAIDKVVADTSGKNPNTTLVNGALTLSTGSGDDLKIGSATNNGFSKLGLTGAAEEKTVARTNLRGDIDALVKTINESAVKNSIKADNDGGKLRITNLSTEKMTVDGVSSDGASVVGSGGTAPKQAAIEGNSVRKNLIGQFNELRTQLDKLSQDASFNGINLLQGDNLKITFNETGTSSIDIQAKTKDGAATSINVSSLSIAEGDKAEFGDDASLDTRLSGLQNALMSIRTQASTFGSNLSIVQNRQDFTKSMINTLETGAGNLTLADMNQEAANMMALQTRQSLASSTLSMANQADQGVLQLLR